MREVGQLLLGGTASVAGSATCQPSTLSKVYPLSLIAFTASAHALSLPRVPSGEGLGVVRVTVSKHGNGIMRDMEWKTEYEEWAHGHF